MDQKKVDLIKDWPIPTNTSELSRFLGFTGYYRNFIDQYAAITANLTNLLHKDVEWFFGPIQLKTFEFLKQCMVNYPILRLPDLDKPFFIYCDASGAGLGAILAQLDDNGNEYVCEYASRQFQGPEKHYSTIKNIVNTRNWVFIFNGYVV
jgi:hypothetical protein